MFCFENIVIYEMYYVIFIFFYVSFVYFFIDVIFSIVFEGEINEVIKLSENVFVVEFVIEDLVSIFFFGIFELVEKNEEVLFL